MNKLTKPLEIQTFFFEVLGTQFALRGVTLEDGEPGFVRNDVCDVAGLTDYENAVRDLDETEMVYRVIQSPTAVGGAESLTNRPKAILTESGMWAVLLKGRGAKAGAIRRKLAKEILPKLRRGEAILPTVMQASTPIEEAMRIAKAFKEFSESMGLLTGARAVASALGAARDVTHYDLMPHFKDSPLLALKPGEGGRHNPTNLSAKMKLIERGLVKSDRDGAALVNQILLQIDKQHLNPAGKPKFILCEGVEGIYAEYREEPLKNNEGTIRVIYWNDAIIPLLEKVLTS